VEEEQHADLGNRMSGTTNSKQELNSIGLGLNLGIVCPMANEKDNAVAFVQELLAVCDQFSFERVELYTIFDNVCVDGSHALLQGLAESNSRICVVWAPENRCVVDAYKRGYQEALDRENDWILEIDAGFSHDPKQIPDFFREMSKGRDCVFGARFGIRGAVFDGGFSRKIISMGGTLLTNLLVGTRMPDMTSGFELFSRSALETILARGVFSKGPFFQTEIRTHAHQLNYALVPIAYRSPSHVVGSTVLRDALAGLWRLYQQRNI
jgi:dolichol-phosphate mannosyltransferase